MKAQTDKTGTEKSKAVANTASAAVHEAAEAEVLFEDKRPEVVAQKQLAEKADSSPQAGRIAQLQAMANAASVEPVQREGLGGEGEQLEEESEPAEGIVKEEAIQTRSPVVQKKEEKPANNTGLPDTLKSGIEGLSGLSMEDVKVHYNSAKPAQLQAHAFAQGTDIHMAPGQEKHLPHEAWHVVQQKQGRVKPTKQLKGKVNVNDDAGLEKEADVMGGEAKKRTNKNNRSNFPAKSNNQPQIIQNLVMQRTGPDLKGPSSPFKAQVGIVTEQVPKAKAAVVKEAKAAVSANKSTSAKVVFAALIGGLTGAVLGLAIGSLAGLPMAAKDTYKSIKKNQGNAALWDIVLGLPLRYLRKVAVTTTLGALAGAGGGAAYALYTSKGVIAGYVQNRVVEEYDNVQPSLDEFKKVLEENQGLKAVLEELKTAYKDKKEDDIETIANKMVTELKSTASGSQVEEAQVEEAQVEDVINLPGTPFEHSD